MKQVIVVLHLANLTGTLNHLSNNAGEKIRVDYKALLEYLVGDRRLVKALAISQKDVRYSHSNKNEAFLKNLSKLGWVPYSIIYDSSNQESVDNINNIIATNLVDLISEHNMTPDNTEFVFVTGTNTWVPLVDYICNQGFSIEIAYARQATTKALYTDYSFFDISKFVMNSNEALKLANKVNNKETLEPSLK